MKQRLPLFLSALFLFGTFITLAQPPEITYGCRHAHNQVSLKPLTAAEKDLLNESNERSDTIDILNYNITLDITDFSGATIHGSCAIQFSPKMEDVSQMSLDLLDLPVDSVKVGEGHWEYTYDGNFLNIQFAEPLGMSDTVEVVIFYGGQPTPAESGFGGMAFQNGIAYNLGIGLGANPYNYGRGWFPCFDNFVEWATYDLNIISDNGRRAYAIGTFLGEEPWEEDQLMRRFRMNQPLPTYLVGVAVSDYVTIDYVHEGAYGDHPVQLIARPGDLADMENSFEFLPDAIDAFEAWYGPYIWERVGFVLTPNGAMEHCTNIAFPTFSGVAGPVPATNRLMAHELAHHWWGNVTTLSSPSNMWIKEGNAEYGAHLFTEYTFGREAFLDQVKDNLLLVLRTAHVEDEGYQPLSGIPYEHTYGVHTYQKGASMLHNLRGYLGDTLFHQAQTAVLEEFTYQSINAEQYRDHLSLVSGVDMTSCFDDWIFSPGFADYEVDALSATPAGEGYAVDLTIQQKLRAAPHFHTNVPLEITFYGADWTEVTQAFMVSDEFTELSTNLDFEPVFAVINQEQRLNLGRMNNRQVIREADNLNTSYVNVLQLEALEVPDSALLNIVHHWTAPDVPADQPNIQMSSNHYWTVRGLFPEGYAMKATLRYQGGSNQLDVDLVSDTDQDLILVWRPDQESPWQEYPDYDKVALGSSGFIRINPWVPGDYAFANGSFTVDAEALTLPTPTVRLAPNPVRNLAQVSAELPQGWNEALEMNVYAMTGQLLHQERMNPGEEWRTQFSVQDWPAGTYVLEIRSASSSQAMEFIVQP